MYHFQPSKNIFYTKWDIRNDAKNNFEKGTINAPVHSEQLCFLSVIISFSQTLQRMLITWEK